MRVAFLTRYSSKGASSRVRAIQYLPLLARHGIDAITLPLLSDRYLTCLYAGTRSLAESLRCYMRRLMQLRQTDSFDLLWVEIGRAHV